MNFIYIALSFRVFIKFYNKVDARSNSIKNQLNWYSYALALVPPWLLPAPMSPALSGRSTRSLRAIYLRPAYKEAY